MRQYKFVQKKNLWFLISALIIIVGFSFSVSRIFKQNPPLNFGIDFTGGSTMLIQFTDTDTAIKMSSTDIISKVRKELRSFGLAKSMIRATSENEILVRTTPIENSVRKEILKGINNNIAQAQLVEADLIGPSIGAELRQKSLWIILVVTFALLLYITWRFEFIFGLAALMALLHDALITLSISSIFQVEINTAFVAALLTILGYSINDTIVVFDRIRENYKLSKKQKNIKVVDLVNLSINQTLLRSVNTSLTTLFFLISLLVLGGTTIKGFCFVLLVGITAGTYSSIFIASPILVMLTGEKQMVKK